jgi:hypothetical protein
MTDRAWIIDQLVALAEGFGTPLTPQRLMIYVDNLQDLDQAKLAQAMCRTVRESKFFPTVAELRQRAGHDAAQDADLAAEAAWQRTLENIRKYGVHRLPTIRNGEMVAPPRLDERTEYSIQAAGGRVAINDSLNAENVSAESFSKKRFLEAFANYDETKVAALAQLPGEVKGIIKQLLPAPTSARQTDSEKRTTAPPRIVKPVPPPLTDADVEARRTLLAQQAAELAQRFEQ